MKNSRSLSDKILNINKKTGIDKSVILKYYLYERFLERLAISEYKNNFIIKGGFYLSSILGLNTRTTRDLDTCLKNKVLTEKNLLEILNNIINIDLSDNTIFTLEEISPINANDVYNGFSVCISVNIFNIRDKIYIDVATGDKITPHEIKYTYTTLIDNININLLAYNMETVLAEKIHAILTKAEATSRMKDYYDIYLIKNFLWNKVDIILLKSAVYNTFKFRDSLLTLESGLNILDILNESNILAQMWSTYKRKNKINVSYEDVIVSLNEIVNYIN